MKYPGLRYQPDNENRQGRLLRFVRGFLRSQFGRPTGLWGSVAGRVMARAPSNNDRIHFTLSLLDIQPGDRVLEIGFGPGVAIQQLSRSTKAGFIAGVDHSPVMVRQATRRNIAAVREGRVALRLGTASDLPAFDQPFDKIFTINSIHFWTDPVDSLRQLRALLKPGGLIAVAVQPRMRLATDETSRMIGEEIAENLERAGFSGRRLEIRKMEPVAVACAVGVRPGADPELR